MNIEIENYAQYTVILEGLKLIAAEEYKVGNPDADILEAVEALTLQLDD